MQQFLSLLPAWSLLCDVGCGNGKYLGLSPQLFALGTDRSLPLLQQAQAKLPSGSLLAADALKLPLRSSTFDAFLSIAVLHHFSTAALRHGAIDELTRILRVGGTGLIYVWALEQGEEGRRFAEQDNLVPWHLQRQFEGAERGDCEEDAEKKTLVYRRFYHVFRQGELEELLRAHADLRITDSYYDRDNWCCQVTRLH